jgi:hypothetical protein
VNRRSDPPLCPSGRARQPGAVVFGIVGAGAGDGLAYLDRVKPVDAEVLALAAPLDPANIYRVAVPCAGEGCRHFEGGACQVAARMLRHLDAAAEALPRCAIRPACRWWREAGPAACRRCPEIATTPLAPRPADLRIAGEAGGGVTGDYS